MQHDRTTPSFPPPPAARVLRALLERVRSLVAVIGMLLAVGLAASVIALWGFVELVEGVLEGETRSFDEAVLRWVDGNAAAWMERVAIEVTALGETLVLTVLAAVVALLFRMAGDRFAAWLMVAAFGGGVVLNTALKLLVGRERPEIFEPVDTAASLSSFPSAHAMLSMVTYATLAWLVAQHEPPRSTRLLVPLFSALLILLIGLSRLFLGVHYPSDVIAGYAVGFAWATFCAATVQGIRGVRGGPAANPH